MTFTAKYIFFIFSYLYDDVIFACKYRLTQWVCIYANIKYTNEEGKERTMLSGINCETWRHA